LWSDEPESAIQASPAPSSSSSSIADLFGVGEASPSTGQATPAAPAAPTSSEGGEAEGSSSNTGLTIGIGKATDTITQDAMIAALWGLVTGGIPGAIQGGSKSYVQDTLAVLNEVNKTDDSIQALNALQGWTDTRAPAPVVSDQTNYNTLYDSTNDSRVNPAPVVSGQTNYNTPSSGMLSKESISLAETPAPADPPTAFPVTPQVTTPAFTTPVISGINTVTPLGLQVDPGIQAAVDAVAQAQAQAAAEEAAAAQAAQAAAQAQAQAEAQAAAQAQAQAEAQAAAEAAYAEQEAANAAAQAQAEAQAQAQAAAEAAFAEQAAANAAADAQAEAQADANAQANAAAAEANASQGGVSAAQAAANAADAAAVASAEAAMAASIGGGGGDGDKIICTAMNHAYGFGSFRNAIWIKYSNQHLTKEHEKGYHALFLPLVDYGFKQGDGTMNKIVRKVLEWGTRHRSTDLRAEMRGKKRDTTGRIIRAIFEPLCYFVGKYK
jgi:flagellar biosynthesis GTPase FlhF